MRFLYMIPTRLQLIRIAMKWKWKISFYYCKDKVSSGRRFAGKYALQCHNKAHGMAWRGVAWCIALHCKCHILHTRWAAQMSAFEFKFEFEFWISLFGASCCFCLHYFEGKMMMVDLAWLTACLPACISFTRLQTIPLSQKNVVVRVHI